ncbi:MULTISPECIES: MATE family efflux transporter [Jonquetella]|uniref:Putative efflux protein, MATE family n=1 Tax=Jonquetella anthropi DSM 22815 TaxID=885272 RepID=H0UIH2_9BACT|nr:MULTISPECIES: MATE family efflux transporter [Jonquetella]EHM12680.1 putative efflux protein, MATE family [Jonquetella anthropi DSM 22815]ERL24666.1 MATE efflux family protein [Jonquetella sp. BV3C21]
MTSNAKSYETAMTQGSISRHLFRFFLPIFCGAFFQQLYQMTDAVIVGQFAGKVAFGALDATASFTRLPIILFLGLSAGGGIVIAQAFGASRYGRLSQAIHSTLAASLIMSVILSAIAYLLTPTMIRAMNVPLEMQPHALSYVRTTFCGLIFSFTYNVGNGVLRALGDSRRPFYYLVASCLINIVLDLAFVAGLGLGVFGAALATVISQALTSVWVLRALTRLDSRWQLRLSRLRIHGKILRLIARTGIPLACQSLSYPITNIFLQSAVNSFGTDVVAAWSVSGKIDFIIWMAVDALAASISTFTAQNYGAGAFDRIRKGLRVGVFISFGMLAPLSAALFTFAKPLGGLFLPDQNVLSLAQYFVRVFMTPFYFIYSIGELISGMIRGTGDTFRPMIISLLCTCCFRLLWVFFVIQRFNNIDVILTVYPASWLLASAVFSAYYFINCRRSLLPAETAQA